jgi:hypothetical protein
MIKMNSRTFIRVTAALFLAAVLILVFVMAQEAQAPPPAGAGAGKGTVSFSPMANALC